MFAFAKVTLKTFLDSCVYGLQCLSSGDTSFTEGLFGYFLGHRFLLFLLSFPLG